MHKYGSLTPIIIKDRYSHLLRKADSKGPKKGRPRIFDIIAPEESQCHQ